MRLRSLRIALLGLSLALVPALLLAQELSASDAEALRAMARFAEAELAGGAREGAEATRLNAAENEKHISRMVRDLRGHTEALRTAGINVDIASVGILFSDLGKNAKYLEAHANRVFPELYKENPGLAKFKAFLLHEEPGIEKVRELARTHGLSEGTTKRVVDAIVGHNGPASEGSWWKTNWDNLIRDHKGPANSSLVGKSYPTTTSIEGAVHAVFDRIDQGALTRTAEGWEGGPRKIHNDIRGNMGFREALTEALEGNPSKTLPQLEVLRAQHPKLFELEVVRGGVERLETTRRLLNHVEFITEADGSVKSARIHSLDANGQPRSKVVTEFAEIWSELGKVRFPIEGAKAWTAEGLQRQRVAARNGDFSPAELSRIESERSRLLEEATRRLKPEEVTRLRDVIEFAERAHAGMRRDGGEAAIEHSLRVAREVIASGRGTVVSASAAVLHDVVEDTKVGLEPIRARYGDKVATAVEALTLGPIQPGSSKELRDKAYYERFASASRDAQVVKFYDRRDNIRDMRGWPTEGKLGYLESTRAKVINALERNSPDLARELRTEVETIERAVRAAEGPAPEVLARYRRADGTLDWKRLTADKALGQGAGVAHFALALFLKELAVVVKTGDRLRIDEFFDGLMTTDFFVTYGLFSVGAQGANVAYSRYLEKYIKPKFVSGILRTNIVLATGMALPEIVHGTFDGKAFAIDVASLGLSSVAVKAGLRSIGWVTELGTGGRAGRLLNQGARFTRLAKFGGWVYTAAETAVVLYLGEEISSAVNTYLDREAAEEGIAKATEALLAVTNKENASPEELAAAVAAFQAAHADYRNFLYKNLIQDDQIYFARLDRFAQKAKQLADKRNETVARLEQFPALKATVLRKYGTVEAYVESLARKDEAEIDGEVNAALEAYNRARDEHFREVYEGKRRGTPYLADQDYAAAGARPGAANDPYKGRSDIFARWGRDRLQSGLRSAAGEISGNRIEAYDDEAAALRLASSLLRKPEQRAVFDDAIRRNRELKSADIRLATPSTEASSEGLKGAVEGLNRPAR